MRLRSFALATIAFGLAVAVVSVPVATRAAETDAVMATVHQFVDAFNKGDIKAGAATCWIRTSIIDEFAPYEWEGPTACADWAKAEAADDKANGVTDGIVTLGKPLHVDVVGDRAYVVVPVVYAYKDHGKPAAEKNSVFTVALKKVAAGWRITAWAWSKG